MQLEEAILTNVRSLSLEQQQAVLEFTRTLRDQKKRSRRKLRGLCADLEVTVSEADIAQARQEMWGNFGS
ncbi:hypothetical protein [Leptolyngbya sp. NIES-2104]|uniref:hypothetical protein n=1 Tax=Leptolyngbya sp. NIES-2104 TaxID=1552121 RepID=UPI0006EC64BE|nr:hypothetical protein [Leptolyngbya sp. NIES-2104]GAP96227.1 hypothetical protein NIES2104_27620 [Leptolyngbya sp. NIES-2104]